MSPRCGKSSRPGILLCTILCMNTLVHSSLWFYPVPGQMRFGGVDFSGTLDVSTQDDDDFVGIVFSYQSNKQFYLVSWKQLDQVHWNVKPFRAEAVKGIHIKVWHLVRTMRRPLPRIDHMDLILSFINWIDCLRMIGSSIRRNTNFQRVISGNWATSPAMGDFLILRTLCISK